MFTGATPDLEEHMGLFSFAKSVGAKLFGASEAKAATADELKKMLGMPVSDGAR